MTFGSGGNSGKAFTAEQEQFIIDLRENQPGERLEWKATSERFNERFPDSRRSSGAIQVHYSRSLQPTKRKQSRRDRRPSDAAAKSVKLNDYDNDKDSDVFSNTEANALIALPSTSDDGIPAYAKTPFAFVTKPTSEPQSVGATIKKENLSINSKFDEHTQDIINTGRKRSRKSSLYTKAVMGDTDNDTEDEAYTYAPSIMRPSKIARGSHFTAIQSKSHHLKTSPNSSTEESKATQLDTHETHEEDATSSMTDAALVLVNFSDPKPSVMKIVTDVHDSHTNAKPHADSSVSSKLSDVQDDANGRPFSEDLALPDHGSSSLSSAPSTSEKDENSRDTNSTRHIRNSSSSPAHSPETDNTSPSRMSEASTIRLTDPVDSPHAASTGNERRPRRKTRISTIESSPTRVTGANRPVRSSRTARLTEDGSKKHVTIEDGSSEPNEHRPAAATATRPSTGRTSRTPRSTVAIEQFSEILTNGEVNGESQAKPSDPAASARPLLKLNISYTGPSTQNNVVSAVDPLLGKAPGKRMAEDDAAIDGAQKKKQRDERTLVEWHVADPAVLAAADPKLPNMFKNPPPGRIVEQSNRSIDGQPPSIRVRSAKKKAVMAQVALTISKPPIQAKGKARAKATDRRTSKLRQDSVVDDENTPNSSSSAAQPGLFDLYNPVNHLSQTSGSSPVNDHLFQTSRSSRTIRKPSKLM